MIDQTVFNGRDSGDTLLGLILNQLRPAARQTNPLKPQWVDLLRSPFLLFAVDFDAANGSDDQLRSYLVGLWGDMSTELKDVFQHSAAQAYERDEVQMPLTSEIAQRMIKASQDKAREPDLQQMPATSITALSAIHGRGVMPMGSVTILREGDQVIAGIGCSGATDEQDGECAHAARDAFAS